MIEMTDHARRRLERYLSEARRTLRGHPDLDGQEVLRGLREHVDAELGGRPGTGEPVTAAEMDAVLERLGPPDGLAGEVRTGHAASAGGMPGAADREGVRGALVRLTVAAVLAAGTVVLLLAPGALVWGQAQIGGVLDAAWNPGGPPLPGTRSTDYWIRVGGTVAAVTGVWWAVVGGASARWGGRVREALAPLPCPVRARHGRVLAGAGLVLAAAGAVLLFR
ncbi:MAG TPA: hypothetical protein VKB18_00275 [Gemmatimonadota bacterium]|nr:hypothetical protein [Gemmatimonadota bacterium]